MGFGTPLLSDARRPPTSPCPSQEDVTGDADNSDRISVTLERGLLTHLTRLTRFCTLPRVLLTNDPAVLPSAGASLRVLELACDGNEEDKASIAALLPVAPGLEALDVGASRLTAADAARLAAALPRDIARLRVATVHERVWAALPITILELQDLPADLALLAGASRLERLSVSTISGVEPAALVAALQALTRLRALHLGDYFWGRRAFEPRKRSRGNAAAPAAAAAAAHAPPTADAVDAFVAAAAALPSMRELSLDGFYVGGKAKVALLQAAPRLSALRLSACGLRAAAAAALAAQLRAAAGHALSLYVRGSPI
jgi:hypothetical protein